jgi:hypothetical protein
MAEEIEGEVTRTEAQEGQGSPYILMLTHKSLASCFRLNFSIVLGKEWSNIGLKASFPSSTSPWYPCSSSCLIATRGS